MPPLNLDVHQIKSYDPAAMNESSPFLVEIAERLLT